MTYYNPFKYKSLLQRNIDKNRIIHSQIDLSTNSLLRETTQKNELLEYITVLPQELKRLVFGFIDIDTRLSMLLEKRPYLLTGEKRPTFNDGLGLTDPSNPMAYCLDSKDILKIYKNGFLHPFYYYERATRRWCRQRHFDNPKLFSKRYVQCNKISDLTTGLHINPTRVAMIHPVHNEFSIFRRAIQYNSTQIIHRHGVTWQNEHMVPVLALSLLLNTNAYDPNINYYLRKKAFNFIYEITRVVEPKIIEQKRKDQLALDAIERAGENNQRCSMGIEDKLSIKLRKFDLREQKNKQIIFKRNFAITRFRFRPTLLLLKKRNKIQELKEAKEAKNQAKEQAKQAKNQAKEQSKQAKERDKQAKIQAKIQAKEQSKYEQTLYKKILKNAILKRQQLLNSYEWVEINL